ncbi:cupin domain-containing protein [Candidatus Poribacteria bacterium]
MGKGKNWRVVHPDMGARQITLNHGLHAPGQEFTQHTHGETEDAIVILEGETSMRQGSVLTPIAAGEVAFVPCNEVHGTFNTTENPMRVISFQVPPDVALYLGERDSLEPPKPQFGHRSGIQISTMTKGGPVFGKPGDWRSVISADRGAKNLALDYIQLGSGEEFDHAPTARESVYVVIDGEAKVEADRDRWNLKAHDVIFLQPDDMFLLSQSGDGPVKLVYCWALA